MPISNPYAIFSEGGSTPSVTAANGSSMVLLQNIPALSVNAVDFTLVAGYPRYYFTYQDVILASGQALAVHYFHNGVVQATNTYAWGHFAQLTNSAVSTSPVNNQTGGSIQISGSRTTPVGGLSINGSLTLTSATSTTMYKAIVGETTNYGDAGGVMEHIRFAGTNTNGATAQQPVTGLRFLLGGGVLMSGTFTMYGIRNA